MSAGTTELLLEDFPDAATSDIAARSPLQLFRRRLRKDKVAMTALVFIGLLVLVAVLAPVIVKVLGAADPKQQNYDALDPSCSGVGKRHQDRILRPRGRARSH